MAIVAPTPVAALPTAPSTASPANFDPLADSFLPQLNPFGEGMSALASVTYGNALDAQASAVSAANSASAASSAAVTAGAIAWVPNATYTAGQARHSLVDMQTYRCKTDHSGRPDDPSVQETEAAYWTLVGGISVNGVQTVSGKTMVALKEVSAAVAASAIDCSGANVFTKTATGALTWTATSVPAAGVAYAFILSLTNGGTGVQTWFAGTKWAGGVAPTLTAAGRDVLGFFTFDGGATWNGVMISKDIK